METVSDIDENTTRLPSLNWDESASEAEKCEKIEAWAQEALEAIPNAFFGPFLEACGCIKHHAPSSVWQTLNTTVKEQGDHLAQRHREWTPQVEDHESELKRSDVEESTKYHFTSRPSEVELARRLLQQLEQGGHECIADLGNLYRYRPDRGIWECIWREDYTGPLSREVHDYDGAPILDSDTYEPTGQTVRINSSKTEGVIKAARNQRQDYWEEYPHPFFSSSPAGAVFANGFMYADRSAGELQFRDHAPEHAQRVGFDFEFDPNARPTLFLDYLRGAFEPDPSPEEKIKLVGEMMGAGLLGLATFDIAGRAFMLHGEKGTGKSTLLKVLSALYPDDAITHLPPQELCDSTEGAGLEGARLNLVYEAPQKQVLRESGFKAIVHGETVRRRAPYRQEVEFSPDALHVFACNELPPAPGATGAFWDRWHAISFNRKFRNTDDEIPDLDRKIINREMKGVTAFAVAGANRLLEQEGYTMPPSSEALLERWQREADPVKQFLADCTSRAVEFDNMQTWAKRSRVWNAWEAWRRENGYNRLNRNTFKSRMQQAGVDYGQSGVERVSLQLKDDWDETLDSVGREQSHSNF